ncbi:inner membrane protein yede [Anaeramoeba ignava]|uniref:Inner membrane protein yede n=1 Tax=Anaeramoeba ignava TaxID=1746090 RepID=A0A9Q0RGT7_ANAIG|nr:inner membrane protein yede [Anaeramoeba ignava]
MSSKLRIYTASFFRFIFPILLIIGLYILFLLRYDLRRSLIFLIGIGFGYTLKRARFGYTSHFRKLLHGRGQGMRAQIIMFLVTSLIALPIYYHSKPIFKQNKDFSTNLYPVSTSVLLGAFIFGIGQQLGDCCASGVLYDVGSGNIRAVWVLIFFISGTVIEYIFQIHNHGIQLLLFYVFGFALAYFVTILIEIKVHGGVEESWLQKIISKFHKKESQDQEIDEIKQLLVPINEPQEEKSLFFKLFQSNWSYLTGAFILSGIQILFLFVGGELLVVNYGELWEYSKLPKDLLANDYFILDLAVIIGSFLAASYMKSFGKSQSFNPISWVGGIFGGIFLGFGSRLAGGCNIGALTSGIVSWSVTAFTWYVCAMCGNLVGMYLRPIFKIPTSPTPKKRN